MFAIDATTNTLAASSVLWEAHAGMKAYEELGNVLSDVQVGRMMDGTWAPPVIKSTSGVADAATSSFGSSIPGSSIH